MRSRSTALIGLVAGSLLLSGCAAAMVPIIAGGALARTSMDKHDKQDAVSAPATAEPAATSPATATPAAPSDAPFPVQTAIPASSPAQVALAGKLRRDQVEIVSGGLPPPSGTAGGISDGGSTADPIAAFADYADKAGTVPPIGYERHSAMLANPAALDGKTAVCSVHPAAVLVDLDPKGSTFAVPEHPAAAPGLATALARLRTDGITVGWASGATADQAGAISKALVASGLDPLGKDTLVLLRYPDDRKETRRQDFAKQYCVVAIAGEDRTDFDELYAYLKDPSAALPLEKLVGKGWFLIPQPLS